jgi:hypothetical protein
MQVLHSLLAIRFDEEVTPSDLAAFANLAPFLNSKLLGGGFQPLVSASLPSSSKVQLFGAVGDRAMNWAANSVTAEHVKIDQPIGQARLDLWLGRR